MTYRNLTKKEIKKLLAQNCFAENWNHITVREGFSADNIRNTSFYGSVEIGINSGTIDIEDGISVLCGIYNSSIRDCNISDQVCISEVGNLSNYIIEENVAIRNTGSLIVKGETTFGNGTTIDVLNEGGGRELPIFDRLTSQTGYLTVVYRHDKDFISKMLELVNDYCRSKRRDRGLIKTGTRIIDCAQIYNVSIGSYTTISGAGLLEEGTIASCEMAPVYIGTGVVGKKFIILSGSSIDGGAILDKCFIGQGVKIGKQFSAENSAFFANCEAYHGEACSLFAGPYTVTHHKSTLMIASLASFFNAGSGTNQSNHMYKLGPLHQGILERGSKTGSFSYLLLPVHIGPFTVVMGKHYSNFDTSDLPFSYITEEKDKSELTPAMNLFTVGTKRDIDKWPARDRRKDPDKLDLINFELFSPYIAGKINNAISILNRLSEGAVGKHEYVNFKGINIRRLLLKTTGKYYETALKVCIGRELFRRVKSLENTSSLSDLKSMLATDGNEGSGRWLDVCGLFSPSTKIDELVDAVKTGKIRSVDDLNEMLKSIHNHYDKFSWVWFSDLISHKTGFKPEELPVDNIIQIISDWKSNTVKLNNMILNDAEKEFGPNARFGFGIDGDAQTRDNDFTSVRGTFDNNKFVAGLKKESRETEEKADRLINILSGIK